MHTERPHFFFKIVFAIYLCLLIYIVFFTPNRVEGDYTFVHPVLLPLVDIIKKMIRGPWKSTPNEYWSGFYGNVFGNILIFIPFGFFLKIFLQKASNKRIILISALTSAAIELLQLIFRVGVCDINDVILNVSGTCAGLLIYIQLAKRSKWLCLASGL